jgi:hypothetical protein
LGSGQHVATFGECQGRAEASEQKQQSTVHRDFLSNGALFEPGSALIEFRNPDVACGSMHLARLCSVNA